MAEKEALSEQRIREIVREEIEAYMQRAKQTRGWEQVKPWPPVEKKGKD